MRSLATGGLPCKSRWDAPLYTKHAAANAPKSSMVREGVLQKRNSLLRLPSRMFDVQLLDHRSQPGDGLRSDRIEHDLDMADSSGIKRPERVGDLFSRAGDALRGSLTLRSGLAKRSARPGHEKRGGPLDFSWIAADLGTDHIDPVVEGMQPFNGIA